MTGRALAHTLALLRFRMRSNDEARAEIRAPEVRCIRLGCGARAAERSSSSRAGALLWLLRLKESCDTLSKVRWLSFTPCPVCGANCHLGRNQR